MKGLITICTIILIAGGMASASVYTNEANWYAAVSGYTVSTEYFSATPFTDFTIQSDFIDGGGAGGISVTGYVGQWYDRVDDEDEGNMETTIQFNQTIYGFGADWDLEGPTGPGEGLEVVVNSIVEASIPNSAQGSFYGIADIGGFDAVVIRGGNIRPKYCETFAMDNAVYAVPVPGAVLLGILGLSVAGIKLRKFA